MSGRGAALGVLLTAGLALWAACSKTEDPETQIRRALEAAAAAAERKDVAGVMEIISEDIKSRGMTRSDVKRLVFGQLRVGDWQKVMLVRTVVAVENETQAKAETTVVLARGSVESVKDAVNANSGTYRFDLAFRKESGGWRVVNVEYQRASLKDLLGVE